MLTIFVSLLFIIMNNKYDGVVRFKNMMETSISSLFYIANAPRELLDKVSDRFISQSTLQLENQLLRQTLKEKNVELLLLEQLKMENQRLRILLNSPLRHDEQKKIVEVLSADSYLYNQQVVINHGSSEGVFVGQPIVDEKGIVGQVISTGQTTSRVLLISDVTHSIPVRVLRSDIQLIATGTGQTNELQIENVLYSADVVEGDLLITSGLDGRFPEGYPVAKVTSVIREQQSHFIEVKAEPLASLDRLRYLLLLWPTNQDVLTLIN